VVKIVRLFPIERRLSMIHIGRSALAIGAAAASLVTALGGVAAAAPASTGNGVKGNPQPELKPFIIGSSNYVGGSVAIEPDGTLVVARGAASGNGKSPSACSLAGPPSARRP
jgi:hypothetical protein